MIEWVEARLGKREHDFDATDYSGLVASGFIDPFMDGFIVSIQQEHADEAWVECYNPGEYELIGRSSGTVFETELKPLYVVEYRDRLKHPDRWEHSYTWTREANAVEDAEKKSNDLKGRQYRVRKVDE